jgi:hypothetical protein
MNDSPQLFHVSINGQSYGPYPESALAEWASSGQIDLSAFVWYDNHWLPITSFIASAEIRRSDSPESVDPKIAIPKASQSRLPPHVVREDVMFPYALVPFNVGAGLIALSGGLFCYSFYALAGQERVRSLVMSFSAGVFCLGLLLVLCFANGVYVFSSGSRDFLRQWRFFGRLRSRHIAAPGIVDSIVIAGRQFEAKSAGDSLGSEFGVAGRLAGNVYDSSIAEASPTFRVSVRLKTGETFPLTRFMKNIPWELDKRIKDAAAIAGCEVVHMSGGYRMKKGGR